MRKPYFCTSGVIRKRSSRAISAPGAILITNRRFTVPPISLFLPLTLTGGRCAHAESNAHSTLRGAMPDPAICLSSVMVRGRDSQARTGAADPLALRGVFAPRRRAAH